MAAPTPTSDSTSSSSDLLSQDPRNDITDSEWAVSQILSHTDPRSVCRLAVLNRIFLAASKSDLVWARMLPLAYPRVLERADGEPLQIASKKELYFCLCRSISLDNGAKKYWLDRSTGAECYMLSAKSLSIAWGDNENYWRWSPRGGSWFPEAAHLLAVCWFDIKGTFREVLQPGTYTVSFRMQLMGDKDSERTAYGWSRAPVTVSLSTSNGHQVESQRFFDQAFTDSDPPIFSESDALGPSAWVECDAGEFTVEDDENAVEVQFSMKEIETQMWKGGFLLDGVMVRPSHVVRQAPGRATSSMDSPANLPHEKSPSS